MKVLVASFASESTLVDALPRLRALGKIETYTPKALETDAKSDDSPAILPIIVLVAGMTGTALGFAMQVYANTVSYPIDIGGRPAFSWPAFVPIAFEIGVLAAMLAGFTGYLVINRLPHLYDPVDEAVLMRRATTDRWCVAIHTATPDHAHELLRTLGPEQVEELPT